MESSHVDEWVIECSDEEMYDIKERMITNPRGDQVWQPEGAKIAELYKQIERDGFIPLKWICPGRRPPSVPSEVSEDKKKQVDISESKVKLNETNEFDFDEDQPQNGASFPKITTKRRSNQGTRKVTKLEKVMSDMKRYNSVQSSGS
ncbi:PAXIP1-associated glutamate-rich protein 1A-like [Brevipalpus obovatus]|uniref:PAXIP1-associated glutamate-rich protein 1A-like n=1 Tax=Brevipalpus obovatus TaxID=246614 RepID=UPI003D9ECC91